MQKRKTNPESCVLLQAMVRNAEVRFVFRGRIKESDQVLGMSDPGARAERGQSSPERSALKVENHQDLSERSERYEQQAKRLRVWRANCL